jgi:hypothetical protein
MSSAGYRALVVAVICAGSVLIAGCGEDVSGGGGAPVPPPPEACGRDPTTDPGTEDAFARLEWAFPGHWTGAAHTPPDWYPGPEYPVDFIFSEDGHYTSKCLIDGCAALYYGSDGGGPNRRYWLTDVLADGTGIGKIQVFFEDTGGDVTTGDLEEITFSEDLSQLWFAFYPSWLSKIGPIRYELSCGAP